MNEIIASIGIIMMFIPLFMKSKKTGKRTYVEIKEWLVKQHNKPGVE